jgi:ATPase subunit of ABC transporter with duplicated ATPase domains
MRYGAKVLFDEVSTAFTPEKRYGLTGPNGAGKSTFMKLLTGELDPQKGTVVRPRKFGVISQDQFAFDSHRVIDTVIMGNRRLWAAMVERDRIYEKPEITNEDGMKLGELEGIVGEEDGYTAETDAALLLQGLDIPDELHERKMGEMQGGQKVRVLLAQALFGHPQALLLDEPTNHLDLDSIHWLQEFLNRYDGVLIVISHDRHFLNSVCTHIADIDYETIITYTGTYDEMVLQKTQIRSQIEGHNAQREKKISQLNEFIARFAAGTRSSQVQSRRKEVERLQLTELARSNIQRPFIRFDQKRPSGKHILELEKVVKSYDDNDVVKGFTASVTRGERIALMGRNGAGKTTLVNAILANSPTIPESELRSTSGYRGSFIDDGKVIWGHEAAVGYFPQDHRSLIEPGMTALEWLHRFDPGASTEEIRGLLGQMLFARDEGNKKTDVLSGGEAARLLFCKLMLQKPNVLVFDEPTNHLDLESINALNIALQRYQGTALLVSHDHDLIDEVATRIWHFENDHQITDFKGSYEEYQQAVAV